MVNAMKTKDLTNKAPMRILPPIWRNRMLGGNQTNSS